MKVGDIVLFNTGEKWRPMIVVDHFEGSTVIGLGRVILSLGDKQAIRRLSQETMITGQDLTVGDVQQGDGPGQWKPKE